MTTSANSERERLDLSRFEGHTPGPWTSIRIGTDGNGFARSEETQLCNERGSAALIVTQDGSREGRANVNLAAAAPQLLAELTSLRACVSRKDEEIAGLRDLIRRWTGTEPEDLFAAEAIQPSGRCAEGREEDNARNL